MTDIVTTKVRQEVVAKAYEKVMTSLEGEEDSVSILACLAGVILIQKPEISAKALYQLISNSSDYIALNLTDIESVN